MQKTITFLMFVGNQFGKAEEAIKLYTSLLPNSEIKNIEYYKGGEPQGKEGAVKKVLFTIDGLEYMAIDSNGHNFTFTPSISIFVNCKDEKEINTVYEKLVDGGQVLMPLGKYPFSEKFSWINDKYGVSWQLNLATK